VDHATSHALVSIVTPTLNQARFLEDTIESIKAQSYRPLEHIVVDGGSTERNPRDPAPVCGVIRPPLGERARSGMYDAANKGMRLARGSVLCYLNSDDLFLPWTIESVASAFDEDPTADIIYGDALRFMRRSTRSIYFQVPFR
jgi:glycosyltransferase involved in cell wall biosynthesis